MVFKENNKAIYLQIADRICDEVMTGTVEEGARIPSVREYAASSYLLVLRSNLSGLRNST